jgi:hypothetical protein
MQVNSIKMILFTCLIYLKADDRLLTEVQIDQVVLHLFKCHGCTLMIRLQITYS